METGILESRLTSYSGADGEGYRHRLCGPGHDNQSGGQEESAESGERKIEDGWWLSRRYIT